MKRTTVVTTVATIAGLVVLAGLGTVVVVATGVYNVAATAQHTPVVRWLLNTAMERSISARADRAPQQPVTDSETVLYGFDEYHEMCVTCHGAPGVEPSEIGKGLNPEPPDLVQTAAEWKDRELFWIIKHGIKLAGMPAFGPTHSDSDIWGIVAFVRRLQSITPEEYARLTSQAEGHHEARGSDRAPAAAAAEMHAVDHSEAAAPTHQPAADVVRQRNMTAMGHAARPGARSVAESPGHDAQPVGDQTTEKLKTLVAELLRDSIVQERIRADSGLWRRWQSENLRKQLMR